MNESALPENYDKPAVRRVVGAAAIGTFIEWYDFALYGAASALVFGPLFFPNQSAVGGTLASFAVFAVAFFVRPLGGMVAAHVGDRIGRKPVLIFTVSLMGIATVLVGLLPTYEQIGIWAPVLLVITRMLQGVGAGAEFAGAVTAISEYAPPHRRAFYTSFTQAAVGASIAFSTGLFALLAMLPRDVLLDWAWRVPFLASAAIFVVAIFIRRRVEETPAFVRAAEQAAKDVNAAVKVPLVTAIKESPRALVVGVLSGSGLNVAGYAINTFSLSYIKNTLEMSATVATLGVVAAAGSSVVAVPLFGRLADRYGRRRILAFGAIFTAVYMWPYFALLDTRNPALVIVAMTIAYGVGQSAMLGAQSAFLSELFETRYRFTGIAASREVNVMLLGGTTPFIATALVEAAGGSSWGVVVFIVACQLITVIGLALATPRGKATATGEPSSSAPVQAATR